MWFFPVYRPYAVIHTCAVWDKKKRSPLVPNTGNILLPDWPAVKNPVENLLLYFWFCWRPPGSWSHVFRPGCLPEFACEFCGTAGTRLPAHHVP